MPPTRSLRQRTATNENDENATTATTRLTRAKAAALAVPESQGVVKKALGTRNTANTSTAGVQRKRAALGDVSNVTKQENGDGKQLKKPASSR
ncbi:hypothetical protein FQN49_008835, partial [Arthroderma sp. PD_2]